MNSRNNSLWPSNSNLAPLNINRQRNERISLLSPSNNFLENSNFPLFSGNSNFLPIRGGGGGEFNNPNPEDSRLSHFGFPFEET